MHLGVISILLASLIAFPTALLAQATKDKFQKLPAAKAQQNGNAATKQKAVDPPAANNHATRFLTSDDFAVIVIHPKSFFTDPANDLLPVEIITAMGLKEGGIDPTKIERITFTFSDIKRLPAPPQSVGVIEMSEPVDPAMVFPQLARLGKLEKTHRNALVRRAQTPDEPSIAFVDDRTILFAPHLKLDRVLAGEPDNSRVARRLASYDGKSHLFAVVDLDAAREPLSMLKDMAAHAPPQFQEFFKLPDLLTAVELKLAITGSTTAELVLHGRDEPAAAEAERLVNQALLMAREMALASMAENMRGPDQELQQATARWLRRISEKVVKSLAPTRDRTRVTITASVDSGYAGFAMIPALLLPAINSARDSARRDASMNNMKQIAVALHNYEVDHKKFPDQANRNDKRTLLSWRVHILPYLDEKELYKEFKLDEPWDSEHNKKLISKMPAIYSNPRSPSTESTNYLLPTKPGTAWNRNEGPRARDITDGMSKTIMLLEPDIFVPWTEPLDYELDPDEPFAHLGRTSRGRFGVAMFDGSARRLTKDMNAKVFLRLLDPRDGQEVEVP